MEDECKVECDIDDLAGIFKNAPPMEVSLTYEEIAFILAQIQNAGYYELIVTGNLTLDKDMAMGIRSKFETALQGHLDKR